MPAMLEPHHTPHHTKPSPDLQPARPNTDANEARTVNCIICDSDATEQQPGQLAPFIAHRTGIPANEGLTIQCRNCGFRYSRVRFTDEQARKIYGDYRTDNYFNERDVFEPGFIANYGHHFKPRNFTQQVETFVLEHCNPKTVLDIGGGNGENTPFHDRAIVTDIGDIPIGQFDLVVMSHVLEHVGSPRELVALAKRHLKPGGYLYTETPVDPPVNVWHEHCQVFGPKSLYILLDPVIKFQQIDNGIGHAYMTLSRF